MAQQLGFGKKSNNLDNLCTGDRGKILTTACGKIGRTNKCLWILDSRGDGVTVGERTSRVAYGTFSRMQILASRPKLAALPIPAIRLWPGYNN